jgi:hypothetical protein
MTSKYNFDQSKVWSNSESIIHILNRLSDVFDDNNLMLPDSGGLNITSANTSGEPHCIEINGMSDIILKPKLLAFEYINNDINWSYVRIETFEMPATGIYTNNNTDIYKENVLEIEPNEYIDMAHWVTNEYENEELPLTARPVLRILKGSIVIFKKSSPYLRVVRSAYSGLHQQYTADEFREFITAVAIEMS